METATNILPTVHGFDEFFGNLYHLNAEEEPERPYWPKDDKQYVDNNSPRGVLRTKATDVDDPTVQPHWGRVGKQTIEDTGPLDRKRMETIDDETTAAAIDYMGRQVKADKPFFVWMNTTRMHVFTHVREAMRGQSGMPGNEYADGMIEHDGDVGKLLKALDDLGIAGNTIVIYTTDNGPNQFSWPDAATTPFRSEKDTNWEGAFRVPAMVRWPGHIKAGDVSTQMFSGLDWFPTLLAAAGDGTIKDRLLQGTDIGGTTFKVHLDGYNQLGYLTGAEQDRATHRFCLLRRRRRSCGATVTATGKRCSRSRRSPAAFRSGTSRSPPIAYQRCSTCAWTLTNAQTLSPTNMTTGG